MRNAERVPKSGGDARQKWVEDGEFYGRSADIVEKCARVLTERIGTVPTLALVLGSGYQGISDVVDSESVIDYSELPGFPQSMVPGHAGKLVCGSFGGVRLLVCCGRAHYYQGHSMEDVTFPVRVFGRAGVRDLLLTNAAGGINAQFRTGDFMLVQDHINFMGENPLRGMPVTDGKCFVDVTDAYSARLRGFLNAGADCLGIQLKKGVYIAVSGPSYETPAEIRAFRNWGADAVGMSTVPEVLMARYCGMEVAAVACITNAAAGMRKEKLSHEEVLENGQKSRGNGARLLQGFMSEYRKEKCN